MNLEAQQRYKQAKRVTLLGAFVNALLGVSKILFGILGHSQALIADGVHSFSDLLTDALVLFAARIGSQEADMEHPYGHARIETAFTMGLAVIIMLAALGIMIDAGMHLLAMTPMEKPTGSVLLVAAISVIANESLYRYSTIIATKINSNLIRANAWHHRSDALSSIVVFIGVGGSMLGYEFLNPLAAIIVGLMILKMGWRLGASSIRELVDTGLDEEKLSHIKTITQGIPGVVTLHQLRTRSMGGDVFVDVHIQVSPRLSVSEGHYISEHVRGRLIRRVKEIRDVTVHIDPEDDETACLSINLLSRDKIIKTLKEHWKNCSAADQIKDITLHYFQGKIAVDILLPTSLLKNNTDTKNLQKEYLKAIHDLDYVNEVNLLFS